MTDTRKRGEDSRPDRKGSMSEELTGIKKAPTTKVVGADDELCL